MDVKDILKAYFTKGAYPTEAQYSELIEAFITSDELANALEDYIKKNAAIATSDTVTLTGTKALIFRQGENSDKPGFTIYKKDGSEAAFFEYKNEGGVAALALGNYIDHTKPGQYSETQIGFRLQDAGNKIFYAVFAPKVGAAKSENPDISSNKYTPTIFYMPLRFKVGDTYVMASTGGTVDLTQAIQTLLQNGNN